MKSKYLKVIKETPILNSSDFRSIFGGNNLDTLKTDDKGHIRSLEFVALKNMIFKIEKKTNFSYIYKISSNFYRSKNLYIDSRFTVSIDHYDDQALKHILDPQKIIKKITSHLGKKYLWGGNYSKGIGDLLKFYPPSNTIDKELLDKWILKGVDCSGILFEATNGFTPRNTSELLSFGKPVFIEKLNPFQIVKIVKPLDLIVFKGHVVVVLDAQFTIESRENFGVIKTSILERLEEIHKTKKPKNIYLNPDDYVIRRWI